MMAVVFEMTLSSEGAFTRDAAFVPVYSLLRNYSVLFRTPSTLMSFDYHFLGD
jgi:hypothetical protein